jgi:hypothetical protein
MSDWPEHLFGEEDREYERVRSLSGHELLIEQLSLPSGTSWPDTIAAAAAAGIVQERYAGRRGSGRSGSAYTQFVLVHGREIVVGTREETHRVNEG